MLSILAIKDLKSLNNIYDRINTYLIHSYYTGYEMNYYFTDKNKILMFERLLNYDDIFRLMWFEGYNIIPKVKTETMYLSQYITTQRKFNKITRYLLRHKYYGKLTKDAENLLKGYLILWSQSNENINEKMNNIFCGIFKNINERKQKIIKKILSKMLHIYEPGIEDLIISFLK